MPLKESVYLVQVTTYLHGGEYIPAFDAIEASSEDEARNVALNYYILAGGDRAVDYGEVITFPGSVLSVTAKVLGVLDMEHPFNKHWKYRLQLSKVPNDNASE